MNEGPFRMPNSADKGDTGQPSSASQPEPPTNHRTEEPKEPVREHKPVHHRTSSLRHPVVDEKSKKPYIIGGIAAAVVAVVALVVWLLLSSMGGSSAPIDSGKYQAVFFTNGQVYFGKLKVVNNDYMQLTDIYYLQTQQSDESKDSKNPQQQTSADQGSAQLIKLGSEIHGPEDEMVIAKTQVLFYENLKTDGKVAKSIAQYKKSH